MADLSRPLKLSRIGLGVERTIEADQAERAALATRFGLIAVEALSATLRITPAFVAGTYAAEGRLYARVVQTCVVSGVDVPETIDGPFAVRFVPVGQESDDLADPTSIDDVPHAGEVLDLGALMAEQLALSLDPYPRAPGATLPEALEETTPASPFAVLASWRGV